jgi:5-deoxy-glucuronate isomerase
MAQSKLLIHPSDGGNGVVHHVTPASAGWRYVGFELRKLRQGERCAVDTGDREVCAILIFGKARFHCGPLRFRDHRRTSECVRRTTVVHLSAAWLLRLRRGGDGLRDRALLSSRGRESLPKPRVIRPGDVDTMTRGTGSNARYVRNVLSDGDTRAESLLVVEVITPGGNWSSYPPHKHDRDALPEESYLEETYYHRLSPPQGFAFQRIYTDDGSLDETLAVGDGDVVLVPRGYHPVGAPHGYDLYYLNVMAGPKRVWRFHNDRAHEWLMKSA